MSRGLATAEGREFRAEEGWGSCASDGPPDKSGNREAIVAQRQW